VFLTEYGYTPYFSANKLKFSTKMPKTGELSCDFLADVEGLLDVPKTKAMSSCSWQAWLPARGGPKGGQFTCFAKKNG
jgi:hypothetical protein